MDAVADSKTSTDEISLTAQQKELSDWRLSGAYATQLVEDVKNWHKENVEDTLKALQELS